MNKLDELVARKIGEMELTIMKQRVTIENMAAELQAKAGEIDALRKKLDEPALPMRENGDARAH
jgi:uncharacterized coiled-coil protein SlyX